MYCKYCGKPIELSGQYCSEECREKITKENDHYNNIMRHRREKLRNELAGMKIGHPERVKAEAMAQGLTYADLQKQKTLELVGKIDVSE